MIDKKKIIKINAGSREDYRQYIYIVPKQADVLKVRDFIIKLKEKYGDLYNSYEAEKGIKQYILRTLQGICLNDFGRSFNINK